jgi:hypothetical protein
VSASHTHTTAKHQRKGSRHRHGSASKGATGARGTTGPAGSGPSRSSTGTPAGNPPKRPLTLAATPGQSVATSLARALVGDDGGIGALLPVLLLASVVLVGGGALRRRREGR